MKGFSVLLFILGISMFANAIAGQWALDFSKTSGGYIALDVVIGAGFWILSWVVWRVHVTRSLLHGKDPLR
jgi:hypothetical protein